MKLKNDTIHITIKVHISMWDALKLRIASSPSSGDSSEAEEDKAAIIAKWEAKQEKSKELYLKRYLRHTFGVCPDCEAQRTLAKFRSMIVEKEE